MRCFLLLLLLLLAGCVSTSYKIDSGAARTISVYSGGGLEGGERWLADGHILMREVYRADGHGRYLLSEQKVRSLAPEQWTAFWLAIDCCGAEGWNPHTPRGALV